MRSRWFWFTLASAILLLTGCYQLRPSRSGWADKMYGTREAVGNTLVDFSKSLDSFFGDPRIEEEYQNLRLDVKFRLFMEERQNSRLSLPVSGVLPLPVLKKKIALVFGGTTEVDDLENADLGDNERKDVSSGLRLLTGKGPLTYKLNIGATWDDGAKLFVQPGVRLERAWQDHIIRITQSFRWDNDNILGEYTTFEYDKGLSRALFFRGQTSAEYTELSDGVELAQGFYFRYKSSRFWAAGLEYVASGSTHPVVTHDSSVFTVRYRSTFLFPWLQQEVAPFLAFRRCNDFDTAVGINFSLKLWIEPPQGRKNNRPRHAP